MALSSQGAPRVPSAYQIERSVSLWQQLQATLSLDPDLATDEAQISDMLAKADVEHPETLLERAIVVAMYSKAVAERAKAEAARVSQFAARYEQREETLRGLIAALMDILNIEQHRTANGIVAYFGVAQPAVEIIDETRLPAEVVKVTRTPDKALIRQRLKDGRTIPGAVLGNPKRSLALRNL
jgi:hypothetical protein